MRLIHSCSRLRPRCRCSRLRPRCRCSHRCPRCCYSHRRPHCCYSRRRPRCCCSRRRPRCCCSRRRRRHLDKADEGDDEPLQLKKNVRSKAKACTILLKIVSPKNINQIVTNLVIGINPTANITVGKFFCLRRFFIARYLNSGFAILAKQLKSYIKHVCM
ncbi:unnamed protein product [Dracunculus medinensis]|uniref:Protamine-2 n=1 Tax=Dracunculus medinensis TaxID=318479 RepID=A0A0N4US76_DRAME|nr:unnamed protein product [Dracunculus medinensis]